MPISFTRRQTNEIIEAAHVNEIQVAVEEIYDHRGPEGPEGKSAYEVWLDAGNTGSVQDFLNYITGPEGPPGVVGVGASSSITLSLANQQLSASVNFGTTAGTVAEGSTLTTKADASALSAHTSAVDAHGVLGVVTGTNNTQTLRNKTLETPTIINFSGATHTHTDAASGGVLQHGSLSGTGTNTHTQIDTHIAAVNNPHAVTKTQVGLGNVDNTADASKPVSAAQQTALDGKVSHAQLAEHVDDDLNPHDVTKTQVGLGLVNNTADVDKPVSTAQQEALDGKSDIGHGHVIADTTGLQVALDGKSSTGHLHDDRYYTEIEIDNILDDIVAGEPAPHDHDERYYTETETNTLLAEKSSTGHTHVTANITDFTTATDERITAQKGNANGLATLGVDSKIPTSQIPALGITEVHTVTSQVTQLALSAQKGDVAVRTDIGRTYIHNGGTVGTMDDWTEISAPDAVSSVNGQVGAITLDKGDLGLGNVDNTSDLNKPISTATQTALNAKANTSHEHAAEDITNGTLSIGRIPTGTTSTTVALGNHLHSGMYAHINHLHDIENVNGLQVALNAKSDTGHTHDTRYYTETEVDSFLATKASSIHDHNTQYSAINHDHDDRYYTEAEINTMMADVGGAEHNHDDRYYTETEINTALDAKQDNLGFIPLNKAGDTFSGNLTGDENSRLILTADGGGINRLITLVSTNDTDRPWISWIDHAGRHRVAFGYHTIDGASLDNHSALEVKTSADPFGTMPADMRTRLSIGTDADITHASFNYVSGLDINYGEYKTETPFGLVLRMPDRSGTSRKVAQFNGSVDASDHVTFDIDPMTFSETENATVRLFRHLATSGARRFSIHRGTGLLDEVFGFDPSNGSIVAKTTGSVAQFNDGTGGTTNAIWGSNLGLVSAGGEARLVSRSTSPIVVYTGGTLNSLGSGTERLRITSSGLITVTGDLAVTGTVDGVDIAGLKSSYDVHTHDDRYYTETEIDTMMADIGAAEHNHDDRYFTETEVTTALAGKANTSHAHAAGDVTSGTFAIARIPTGTTGTTVAFGNHTHAGYASVAHTHDDRYYTEIEVDTALSGKANTTHSHDAGDITAGTLNILRIPTGTTSSTVALGNHTHVGYATASHTHDAADITAGTFSIARIPTGTTSTTVALGNHTHAGYASSIHTHAIGDITGLQSALDGKSDAGHNHNTSYYTKAEVDTALSNVSMNGHTHDDRYYTEAEVNSAITAAKGTVTEVMTEGTLERSDVNSLNFWGGIVAVQSAQAGRVNISPTYSGSGGAHGTTNTVARGDHRHAVISGISFHVSGGGSAITPGTKGFIRIPFTCELISVSILGDVSGSVSFQLWKGTYNDHPLSSANAMHPGSFSFSDTTKAAFSIAATNWNTSTITLGDVIQLNLVSVSNITELHFLLEVGRAI